MRQAEDINVVSSEAGIIASLIRNPNLLFLDDGLKPEHFTNKENRAIFATIKSLIDRGLNELDAFDIANDIDPSYGITVDQIQDFVMQSELLVRNEESYKLAAQKVKEVALRRQLYTKLKECESLCFDADATNVENTIYEMLDQVITEFDIKNDLPEYKDVVDQLWKEIADRQEKENRESMIIKFPFPSLNEYVVMDPGECICFAAPQKAGKSAMLLTCAVDLLKKGKSVLYIDSELSSRLFTMRIIAHLTGIRFGLIRSGGYGDIEAKMIEEAREWLKNQRFIHRYVPILDENQMLMMAKKAKHMIDIDVIIVDYLKANSNDDKAYSVYASLGRVADTLKNKIAGDMGICALTAAQTTDTGKIADSAKIARSVSTVITIMDKSIEEIENDGTGATKKMRVLFNRNGDQHRDGEYIDMNFDGSTCKYEESKKQHVQTEPY
ncbi:MAG: hypothetical protein LIR46_13270 [Bacteroidota bacterium]|nr:hypothetical protein [Bacteroidota bacterium]